VRKNFEKLSAAELAEPYCYPTNDEAAEHRSSQPSEQIARTEQHYGLERIRAGRRRV
jgi:hypothetical protein